MGGKSICWVLYISGSLNTLLLKSMESLQGKHHEPILQMETTEGTWSSSSHTRGSAWRMPTYCITQWPRGTGPHCTPITHGSILQIWIDLHSEPTKWPLVSHLTASICLYFPTIENSATIFNKQTNKTPGRTWHIEVQNTEHDTAFQICLKSLK